MDETLAIFAAVLGFPALWALIMLAIGRFGGWGALAEVYAARDDFQGKRWRFESLRFRAFGHYNGCVTFGANPRGLYMATFFPFRIGHPPLFIPWEDVTMTRTTFFMVPRVELKFRRTAERPLLVRQKLGEMLAAEAGVPLSPRQ